MKTSYIIPSIFLDRVEILNNEVKLAVRNGRVDMPYLGADRDLFDMCNYARVVFLSDILRYGTLEELEKAFQANAINCLIYIEIDILLGKRDVDVFFIKRGIQAYSMLSNIFNENLFFLLVDENYSEYITKILHNELFLRVTPTIMPCEYYQEV